MDDSTKLPADEQAILELIDAAEVAHDRRQIAAAERRLDLGDRLIGQFGTLAALNAELRSDPTIAAPTAAPQETLS